MVDTNLDEKMSSDKDEMTEEFSSFIERLSKIEDSVSEVVEQQTELTHHINDKIDEIDNIYEDIDNIKQRLSNIEEENSIKESKINNINKSLDNVEEQIQDTKGDIEAKTKRFERRLNAIEEMMNLDEKDIADAVKPDASEIEKLSTIPEESRKDELTVRVQRAVVLYENFHEISTPVKSGGERLLSKDIKTFLNGYANTEIKYSQVQRVIDSFVEKTDDEYEDVNTEDGRSILWKPEDS